LYHLSTYSIPLPMHMHTSPYCTLPHTMPTRFMYQKHALFLYMGFDSKSRVESTSSLVLVNPVGSSSTSYTMSCTLCPKFLIITSTLPCFNHKSVYLVSPWYCTPTICGPTFSGRWS
jgi:hypothetical protein